MPGKVRTDSQESQPPYSTQHGRDTHGPQGGVRAIIPKIQLHQQPAIPGTQEPVQCPPCCEAQPWCITAPATPTHPAQGTAAARNVVFVITSPELKAQDFGMKTTAAPANKMHVTQAWGGFIALTCDTARSVSLTEVHHLEPTRKSQLGGNNLCRLSFQLPEKVEQETMLCKVQHRVLPLQITVALFPLYSFFFLLICSLFLFLLFFPFPSPFFNSLQMPRGFCDGAQRAP